MVNQGNLGTRNHISENGSEEQVTETSDHWYTGCSRDGIQISVTMNTLFLCLSSIS